jgi:hypothetical protein
MGDMEARLIAKIEELQLKQAKMSEDFEASSVDKSSANISSLKTV